jgi:DMSO/TMAO reductase YedYZ molybdopterin-dependent catalytic subunit
VLERAGIKPSVRDVVLRAADDYSDSIPLDRAMQDGTLLVYEMNGAPLTPTHGFPVRLLVPGIFGMKNVKWITQIELVDHDYKGYWQNRGWDDRAEYKTMSRIDIPQGSASPTGTIIAGIAFAGDRGVSRVEVSTDGGATWEQTESKAPLSPYSWVLWRRQWSPQQPGEFELQVRATDGRGETQTSRRANPIPDGASGYHRRTIDVG